MSPRIPPKRLPQADLEHVLGELDQTTRLVARHHHFTIQKRVKNQDGEYGPWESQWYYTTIKAALQGYVKHDLRGDRVTGVRGDLNNLVEAIRALDKHVAELGGKLDLDWKRGQA